MSLGFKAGNHGFSLNVTHEPCNWFDKIVACGLADVKAGSIAGRSRTTHEASVNVADQIPSLVKIFGHLMGREMATLSLGGDDKVTKAIINIEHEARALEEKKPSPREPLP